MSPGTEFRSRDLPQDGMGPWGSTKSRPLGLLSLPLNASFPLPSSTLPPKSWHGARAAREVLVGGRAGQ